MFLLKWNGLPDVSTLQEKHIKINKTFGYKNPLHYQEAGSGCYCGFIFCAWALNDCGHGGLGSEPGVAGGFHCLDRRQTSAAQALYNQNPGEAPV
jgi:hypothetical protein